VPGDDVSAEQLDFYLEVSTWVKAQLQSSSRPLVIGVSAPQGAGKSTLTHHLVKLFSKQNFKTLTASVDDFYLCHSDQQGLSDSSSNPYLQQRGYPGTHDIDLMIRCLKALKDGDNLLLPRYDKSAFSGLGDRLPQEKWLKVESRQDLVFFEGWFLGFKAKDTTLPDAHLDEINERLKSYEPIYPQLDGFLYLKPSDPHFTIKWRVEAEHNMRASGKPGMTNDQAEQYIRKFLPAYSMYRNTVELRSSEFSDFKVVEINESRLPV
jgi:D-glycerate 3-kinase